MTVLANGGNSFPENKTSRTNQEAGPTNFARTVIGIVISLHGDQLEVELSAQELSERTLRTNVRSVCNVNQDRSR